MALNDKQIEDIANAVKALIGAGVDIVASNIIAKSEKKEDSEKPEKIEKELDEKPTT